MTRHTSNSIILSSSLLALIATPIDAFAPGGLQSTRNIAIGNAFHATTKNVASPRRRSIVLNMNKGDETESEIERLRQMAAKLRAEAASLEAEQSQAMADAAERAFKKFDTNQDGEVSLKELKEGLEKSFNMELPAKRVEALMKDFDKSNDGKLQPEEFVTLDRFRSRLDALAREEKEAAKRAADEAKKEKDAVALIQAQLDMLNDKAPTNSDKILSVLPYLFPLLDGLQFARFFVMGNPENPLAVGLGLLYAVYRLIPFGGLIAFFTLSFLSGNPSINRLIRFNMQQAIYLDIALIFPGLIGALVEIVAGSKAPPALFELGSDVMFGLVLLTVGYTMTSSLLGITPNKLPFISSAVEARLPTVDMFDSQGRFDPSRVDKKSKDDTSD